MPEKHVLSRPAVLELLTIDYSNPARLGRPELDRRHDSDQLGSGVIVVSLGLHDHSTFSPRGGEGNTVRTRAPQARACGQALGLGNMSTDPELGPSSRD